MANASNNNDESFTDLLVALAQAVVLAGVPAGGPDARVHGEVAVLAGVAGAAEAGVVAGAGLVLAHGALRAGVGGARGLFDHALEAGEAGRALASVTNQIQSFSLAV